jgi:hypothetical protein
MMRIEALFIAGYTCAPSLPPGQCQDQRTPMDDGEGWRVDHPAFTVNSYLTGYIEYYLE